MSEKLKEQRLKELAFVGVDTHKDEHTACIANCFGQSLGVFTSENRPKELKGLLEKVDETAKSHNLKPVFGLENVMGLGQHFARSLICGGSLSPRAIANRFTVTSAGPPWSLILPRDVIKVPWQREELTSRSQLFKPFVELSA